MKIKQSNLKNFSPKALMDNPQLQLLMVQAKFYRGEIYYTDNEHRILKEWIDKKGKPLMRELWKTIVEQHPEITPSIYKSSTLASILQKGA